MKFTTVTAGLLTFSTIGQAAINLTWTPDEVGRIRIGDEIKVSWETDRTYVRFILVLLSQYRHRMLTF